MLAALWAYDGWNNMPMAAGEVKNPGRSIPFALIAGMALVMLIYCLANLAYFFAVPFGEIVTSNSTGFRDALPVATKAAQTFLGDWGGRVVSIAFILSTLGALNGSILSNARVPFAMAQDGVFFASTARLSPSTHVPVWSIVVQATWSCLLALSGTYDQLTDCVIFASWIFYGLVTSSVFVLRRKLKDVPRPYTTLGYPLVPLVFVVTAAWLVINTLAHRPVESQGPLFRRACVPRLTQARPVPRQLSTSALRTGSALTSLSSFTWLSTPKASVPRAMCPTSCCSTALPTTPVSVIWPLSTMIRIGGWTQLAYWTKRSSP